MILPVPRPSFPDLSLDVPAESSSRECQVWAFPGGLISYNSHAIALHFPLSVPRGSLNQILVQVFVSSGLESSCYEKGNLQAAGFDRTEKNLYLQHF